MYDDVTSAKKKPYDLRIIFLLTVYIITITINKENSIIYTFSHTINLVYKYFKIYSSFYDVKMNINSLLYLNLTLG